MSSTAPEQPLLPIPITPPNPPKPLVRLLNALFTGPHNDTLNHLTRLLSTHAGIDRTLMLLQYTLALLSSQLSKLLTLQLRVIATRFASKASASLLPNERVIATFPAPPTTSALATTIASAKAMSAACSDVRAFLRLWGLLGIYTWARGTWLNPPEDGLVKAITWTQVIVNTGYYVLEHPVYLAGKGVLTGWSAEKQGRWWRAASACFGAHVALEFVKLARIRSSRESRRRALEASQSSMGAGKEGETDAEREEERARVASEMEKIGKEEESWATSLQINAAYAPLCVHWSTPGGFVSDSAYGLLGSWAAALYVRGLWRACA